MKKLSLLALITLLSVFASFGQTMVVHGMVTTLDSIPLIGVEITIKSTKQTITTDTLGRFSAFCNPEDKLKLKAKGFYTENLKVPENVKLLAVNMRLKPGEKQKDYAIGYGYVSAKDLSSPVRNMNVKQSDYTRFNTVYDVIQSMGAQISNGQVILRGVKSFQGNSAALIVVDGVISDYDHLRTLRPIELKRVDILYDAAASAYGSRGANGVVLIETIGK